MAAAVIFALFAFWAAVDLDRDGRQGVVAFDHDTHVKVPQASCSGCHHTRDARGIIQLAKCEGCHGPEGDPRNPQSKGFDEENRKTAFHEMCIGCHANVVKTGPVDCADCHRGKR